MLAETALNVINALPPQELERLYVMLNITTKPKTFKRNQVFTKADAAEYLHRKFKI